MSNFECVKILSCWIPVPVALWAVTMAIFISARLIVWLPVTTCEMLIAARELSLKVDWAGPMSGRTLWLLLETGETKSLLFPSSDNDSDNDDSSLGESVLAISSLGLRFYSLDAIVPPFMLGSRKTLVDRKLSSRLRTGLIFFLGFSWYPAGGLVLLSAFLVVGFVGSLSRVVGFVLFGFNCLELMMVRFFCAAARGCEFFRTVRGDLLGLNFKYITVRLLIEHYILRQCFDPTI